jgi:hypothetical protein
VNSNPPKILPIILSTLGNWLIVFVIFSLLGLFGLGWFVKSLAIVLGLLFIAPVIAFVGLRWWLSRNLIQDQCPVCSVELTGLANSELACPSCGEPLRVQNGQFTRLTPPGTIDVDAVEVSARILED